MIEIDLDKDGRSMEDLFAHLRKHLSAKDFDKDGNVRQSALRRALAEGQFKDEANPESRIANNAPEAP